MNRKMFFTLVSMLPCLGLLGQDTSTPAVSSNYVIQPSDVIRLMVFQEPDLTQEFRVPQNGRFHFPLIGSVDLTGKTVEKAEALLRQLYDRDYLVNPQINLLVIEFSQRRVNVLGAVNSPGTVVFPPEENMTLIDAISRAGGFSRLGNRRSVTLTRKGPDGETKQYRINADEIVRGEGASTWTLEKDDLIYVPERLL
jgi:polysaccharide export outer membrane protein